MLIPKSYPQKFFLATHMRQGYLRARAFETSMAFEQDLSNDHPTILQHLLRGTRKPSAAQIF